MTFQKTEPVAGPQKIVELFVVVDNTEVNYQFDSFAALFLLLKNTPDHVHHFSFSSIRDMEVRLNPASSKL